MIQGTRSHVNFEPFEVIHEVGQDDWRRYGRIRRQCEKKYDSKDILPRAAAERGRQESQPAARLREEGYMKYLRPDAGFYITGGVPTLGNPAGGPPAAERTKRMVQGSSPPLGAQPEQLAEGEDELERARR
jgi:hypothetical protein